MTWYALSLWVSLAVFLAGTACALRRLLRVSAAPEDRAHAPAARLAATWRALLESPRRRPLALARCLVRDILLQAQLLALSPWRFLAHLSLFVGFVGLFAVHAPLPLVAPGLLPGYESTLDPWQFLRNLFGVLALAAVLFHALRRLLDPLARRLTRPGDVLALALLGLILVSGFLLEAVKLQSRSAFTRMVADYLPAPDPKELRALRAHWAATAGTVFPEDAASAASETAAETAALLAQGAAVHETACASCHAPPASAFASRALVAAANRLAPSLAPVLETADAASLLRHVHYLLCFLALAWLPFGKLAHLFAAPASLLARAAAGLDEAPGKTGLETAARRLARNPGASGAVRRALALAACVHCGQCARVCGVAPVAAALGNPLFLPSEKLPALFALVRGKMTSPGDRARLAEGAFGCTGCLKCSLACPCGIDLQDLWLASRRLSPALGAPDPLTVAPPPLPDPLAPTRRPGRMARGQILSRGSKPGALTGLCDDPAPYAPCVQCSACTNLCPVSPSLGVPAEGPAAGPHQVMNLVRMGLRREAMAAELVRTCATCYLCQEFCPQGIRVTDVILELRALSQAAARPDPGKDEDQGGEAPGGRA